MGQDDTSYGATDLYCKYETYQSATNNSSCVLSEWRCITVSKIASHSHSRSKIETGVVAVTIVVLSKSSSFDAFVGLWILQYVVYRTMILLLSVMSRALVSLSDGPLQQYTLKNRRLMSPLCSNSSSRYLSRQPGRYDSVRTRAIWKPL